MTRAEALAEARRRWGESGWAWNDYGIGTPFRMVGTRDRDGDGATAEMLGGGDSWEAAFADASRREEAARKPGTV